MSDFEVPGHWLTCRASELAELIRGVTYQKQDANGTASSGLKPILRANNINGVINLDDLVFIPASLVSDEQQLRTGDILFAMSSGSRHLVGKSARINKDLDAGFGAFCGVLRPSPEVSSEFLFWVFQTREFRRAVSEVSKGSNINNLKREHLLDYEVPLPPLSEQKRIVAKIEELFSELEAGEASLRKARRQLGVYRQSILKQAFEGKLTAQWRTQNPAKLESPASLLARIQADRDTRYTHRLNQWKASAAAAGSKPMKPRTADVVELSCDAIEELPALPPSWIWTSLSQLADHITDGTHKTPKYVEEGIEFISAKDIDDFHISGGTKCITAEEHEELCRRCKPVAGDILLTKSGTIGRTAVVPAGRDFSVFESVAVVPISRILNADFFALQIYRTASGAFGATAQKGVAVRHLHLEDIRRLPTALPSLPEQQEIVRLLDEQFEAIERNERELDAALKRSEALRQAILKKAFTGRLVPQDPADPPASALLARLRAERDSSAPATKRKAARQP